MWLFRTQCLSVHCAKKNMINCKVSQLFILWNHNEQRRAKIIVANKAQFCPGYLQIIPPINVHFWINLSTWTFLAWLKTSRSKNPKLTNLSLVKLALPWQLKKTSRSKTTSRSLSRTPSAPWSWTRASRGIWTRICGGRTHWLSCLTMI
mgnify:CR=1 FL=1